MIAALLQALPEESGALPPRQQFVAVALALAILAVILELVRRRQLREEYSLLWIITGALLLLLAVHYGLLLWLTRQVGAALPTSTLFFGGLIFLILVSLQFSVRLSTMTRRIKDLNQRLAFLEHELRRHAAREEGRPAPTGAPRGPAVGP